MTTSECSQEMRTGRCTLDLGHRGRHSTVTFDCDICGKARRGTPAAVSTNPWDGVVEAVACWFCMNVTIPYANDRVLDRS